MRSRQGSRWLAAQTLAPVPRHHDVTPLHTSGEGGGGGSSQDKAPLAPRDSVMILSFRISSRRRLSDDLHQVCTSLEPGQGEVPLQFPKMQPCSMGVDLSPPVRQLRSSL